MNKRAVVTGAAHGIGRAIASKLAEAEWEVLVIDKSEDVFSGWGHGKVFARQLDVLNTVEFNSYLEELRAEEQGFDGLVNNVGAVDFGPMTESDPRRLERLLKLNVMTAVQMTQGLLPELERRRGRVVHIGSEVVRATGAFSMYGVTKCALEAYAHACRQELELLGLKSILIRPGATDTAILPASVAHSEGRRFDKFIDKFNEIAPRGMKNPVPAAKVAEAVWKALTVKTPKSVYGIGENQALKILALLPQAWRDALFLRMLRN
jgi:NAD(P)-dependent dehydrogenase (short-subunit alcohol dehydrogenase family)